MSTNDLKDHSFSGISHTDEILSPKSASAKKAGRCEFIYDERDKESFYKDLQTFHENRNTPLTRYPKINGREVDLHKLYAEVVKRGGWLKVNLRNEWEELLPVLDLRQKCVNASVAVKYIYTRYLDKYEKAHFLGEDPDRIDELEEDGRHKKWSSKTFNSVPMTYNYSQHIVPEPLRMLHKLSTDMYKGSEYEKLMLSLMSPLPNEQDFAINVCTLMANESKHTLKIEHCPKLLDALLAHAGVFCHFTMRDLFYELYSKIRRHSLQSFWSDCLQDKPAILELTYDDYFQSGDDKFVDMGLARPPLRLPNRECFEDGLAVGPEECRTDLGKLDFLALGRGLGTHDYIGQRVNQVASIIRNISFFEENILTLAKNRTFIRFLIMCSNIRWGNLHHMALDVLGNIANELDLSDPSSDELTRCLLSTLCDGIEGQDRGVIISSLEILYKICQKDTNEEHLHKCLNQKIYDQICLFLSLNDIMLLLYTLECVYALSSLGHKACNSLIQVKGIVDTLVSLVTVEAQSYGPDGCILMRVVETVPGNMLPMVAQNIANLQNVAMQNTVTAQQTHVENTDSHKLIQTTGVHQATSTPSGGIRVPQNVTQIVTKDPVISPPTIVTTNKGQQLQENEQFALSWLAATFESTTSASSRVEQQELYKMYLSASQKTGRRNFVSAIHFPRLVRSVFGVTVGPNLVKTENNGVELNAFYYICIRVKANPMPVHYKGITVPAYQPAQTTTATTTKVSQKSVQKIQNLQIQQQPPQQQQNQAVEVVNQTKNEVGGLQQMAIQIQKNHLPVNKLAAKNIIINKNLTATLHQQNVITNIRTIGNPSQPLINQAIITTTQQHQANLQQANVHIQTAGSSSNGNGPTTSSSLIKSLLANKVTTTTVSDVVDTNTSAAPNNNPNCLITQNVNMHQVAQRQHLQKQKELAAQQQKQQQIHNQTISLPTTTISALVNNPIIQTTPLKVGQTTIKAINANTISLPTTIIEKKSIQTHIETNDSTTTTTTTTTNWDPVPPLAPLSGRQIGVNNLHNDDSNSTGNNSVASSAISSNQINTIDDGDISLISFEGLLVPKSTFSGSSSATEDDGNSKDSFNKTTQMFNANQMLVDLLDKKSVDPPMVKGIKRKLDDDFINETVIITKKPTLDEFNQDEEITVTPSKNAANLYAEMAASILEDEDLEDVTHMQTQQIQQTIIQKAPEPQQKHVINVPVPLQRQIIMTPNNPHQMILSQSPAQGQTVQTQATATIKTESGLQTVPLILQNKIGPGGQQIIQPVIQQAQQQTQYMLATNPQGQTYLVAQQPQQTMNQTLLVTQTPQQQGTPTKTIIILQQPGGPPQAVAQQQIISGPGSSQKVIMTTQQGQQMIVTQVPRAMQHHQIIMNHPTSNIMQSSPNVVISQSGSVIQQGQIQIQTQAQSHIQKQIQIQSQVQIQNNQNLQQQQQQSILSQLPHIPATIKLHQPSVQTQTSQQTQTVVGKFPTQKIVNSVVVSNQQPTVSIVAQQQPTVIQQAPQSQQSQNQIQSQAQLIQTPIKTQDRKQIFVTGSGNIEVTEVIQQNSPTITTTTTATSTIVAPPLPPPPQSLPVPVKHTKTIADIRTDEEFIDPNWLWICDWRGCPRKKFKSLNDIYRHACMVHCPDNLDPGAEIYCQWGAGPGLCDNIPRKRFSLMTHLFDRHCTTESFKAAVQRRMAGGIQSNSHSQPVTIIKNPPTIPAAATEVKGTASPTLSTSSSSSLPPSASAAMHAIKRHSTDFVNPKELMDENEGPVTKSIRLTAALILRNLVMNTSIAKKNVRYYEPHLAGVALSNVESSRTISQILFELNN